MNFKIEAVCFCDVAVCHNGNDEKFHRTNNENYSQVHYEVTDRATEFAISLVLCMNMKIKKKIEQDSRLVSLAQSRIKKPATKCKWI